MGDLLPAIGLTTLRWTMVEQTTMMLLASLADLPDVIDVALAAHIPDRTALDIIKSIGGLRGFHPLSIAAIKHFTSCHEVCRENRNLVVHNTYLRSEDGIEPQIFVLQRVTSRGNLRVINYEIDNTIVYKVAHECLELCAFGRLLFAHIELVKRGGGFLRLPELQPLPKNLLNVLRQVEISEFARPRLDATGWQDWNMPPESSSPEK